MAVFVDAERLIAACRGGDVRLPWLVFAVLEEYLRVGPFEFDASQLAARLADEGSTTRLNAEEIAAWQTQLEPLFTFTDGMVEAKPEFLAANRPA